MKTEPFLAAFVEAFRAVFIDGEPDVEVEVPGTEWVLRRRAISKLELLPHREPPAGLGSSSSSSSRVRPSFAFTSLGPTYQPTNLPSRSTR